MTIIRNFFFNSGAILLPIIYWSLLHYTRLAEYFLSSFVLNIFYMLNGSTEYKLKERIRGIFFKSNLDGAMLSIITSEE